MNLLKRIKMYLKFKKCVNLQCRYNKGATVVNNICEGNTNTRVYGLDWSDCVDCPYFSERKKNKYKQ